MQNCVNCASKTKALFTAPWMPLVLVCTTSALKSAGESAPTAARAELNSACQRKVEI